MLLAKKGLQFEDVPVGSDDELRKQMESLSGGWSVPQIFLDGAPLGGFDELHALDKSGELDRMLGINENA
jgi:glutaredoxin 3